jgi:hypothetical protein
MFDFLKKKPIDRIEGGEISNPEEKNEIAETAIQQNAEDLEEKERKERMAKLMARINTLIERVELLERKVDRLENRTGIKNE